MGNLVVPPFLKWPGGKRWFVQNHSNWLIRAKKRHIEPFLGGGAVFFHLGPKKAVLSDSNEALIETYIAIRDDPDAVSELLRFHHDHHSRSYYYEMRDRRPRNIEVRAARFLYLNRTCFNGLYRVNLNGVFNVPIGSKTAVTLPTDDFAATSHLLRSAKLIASDFERVIAKACAGDFVYVDPPYTVKHNNNNFVKYNEHIFSWADQIRLAKAVRTAALRGAHILISNADHPSVRELYGENVWSQLSVSRFSRLASSSPFRRRTTELVVSNYLSESGEVEEPRY